MNALVEQSADVLGVDRAELDELRANPLINRADLLRRLPKMPREGIDVQQQIRQRLRLLLDLNDQVKALGLDPGLGNEAPAGTPH